MCAVWKNSSYISQVRTTKAETTVIVPIQKEITIIYYEYDYYSNRAGEYSSFRSTLFSFFKPLVRRTSFKHYNILVIDRYTLPWLSIIRFNVLINRIPSTRDIVICFMRFLYTGKIVRVIAFYIVITSS